MNEVAVCEIDCAAGGFAFVLILMIRTERNTGKNGALMQHAGVDVGRL